MPRKNAKKREKAIRKAMGSFGKKKNPALEKASGRRGSVRRAGEPRSFDLPERRSGKSSSPGGKRLYASDDALSAVSGTFSYSGRGFGFLVPDPEFARAGIGDVFIPPRQTAGVGGEVLTKRCLRGLDATIKQALATRWLEPVFVFVKVHLYE